LALVAAAKAADLKAAFAVPITHHHHFSGALLFHARDAKDEDERFKGTEKELDLVAAFNDSHNCETQDVFFQFCKVAGESDTIPLPRRWHRRCGGYLLTTVEKQKKSA
jgi:hypothetical protein